MNLDLSQITAFALEGSCVPEAQVNGGATLTLPAPLRSRLASTVKAGAVSGGKAWPLRAAVVAAPPLAITITF